MLTATNKLVIKYVPVSRENMNGNISNKDEVNGTPSRIENSSQIKMENSTNEAENEKLKKAQNFYLTVN
jgi:hypothetical protein